MSNPIFDEFSGYWKLSEEMTISATKADLAETARILAMQAALYAKTYGELPIPDMSHLLSAANMDEVSLTLLRDGAKAFVGVLGMVSGGLLDDDDEPLQ